jgi:hypothetical protein
MYYVKTMESGVEIIMANISLVEKRQQDNTVLSVVETKPKVAATISGIK